MKKQEKTYFENLDGLRFLCFLSVFFFHSFHSDFEYIKDNELYNLVKVHIFGDGNIGVNFFFVLSGFLITYFLIEEKKKNYQIDLKKFWMRRVLRIWPLFYFCVFFGFFVFPIIKSAFGQTPDESASIWYYLTFLNNFDFINKDLPDASILGVLWSVAIEEQFYLLWPVILYLLPVRRFWIAFSSIIAISLAFRAFYDVPKMHEYHTLSCIGDMAIGSFGAWLIIVKPRVKDLFIYLKRSQILLVYAVFLMIFFFREELLHSTYLVRIFERSIIAVVALFVILEQNYARNSFFKLSRFRTISKLGTITYGLYCLQFIGILFATNITKLFGVNTELWQVLLLETAIALTATILLGKLSYHYLEKPFLRLKDKFAFNRPYRIYMVPTTEAAVDNLTSGPMKEKALHVSAKVKEAQATQ